VSTQDFTTTITVDRPALEVFDAISDVRGWWSATIVGDTTHVGDEFVQHVPDMHWARLRVSELQPGRLVAWQVLDSLFPWVSEPAEWRGTEIRFDLAEADGGTQIRFTHVGLQQQHECFDVCANAWGGYIGGSLKQFITTGTGSPNEDNVATEASSLTS
jgi:Activator of Hsp90 ATPase homolog 1-like protein